MSSVAAEIMAIEKRITNESCLDGIESGEIVIHAPFLTCRYSKKKGGAKFYLGNMPMKNLDKTTLLMVRECILDYIEKNGNIVF